MKHRWLTGIGLLAALAALGCDDRDTGGIVDSGPLTATDAGTSDAATSDAGTSDAGTKHDRTKDDAGH